jgi:imidazolonepropionase-like amidohydrolase
MDMHSHLIGDLEQADEAAPIKSSPRATPMTGVLHARQTLRAGFTTVRDVGTYRAYVDVALRDAIAAGWVEGPRMFVAGAYVTVPGGGGEVTGTGLVGARGDAPRRRQGRGAGAQGRRTTSSTTTPTSSR